MTVNAIISTKRVNKPIEIEPAIEFAAKVRHKHASKCKEHIEDCKICQDNIKWFGHLGPMVLNALLSEAPIRVKRRN